MVVITEFKPNNSYFGKKAILQPKPPITLTCKVSIPKLFTLTPKTLTWELGSEASEQTCILKGNQKEPIHITQNTETNRNFNFKVEAIKDGREYKLTVTPKKTDEPTFGVIRITTDCSVSRFKRGQVSEKKITDCKLWGLKTDSLVELIAKKLSATVDTLLDTLGV